MKIYKKIFRRNDSNFIKRIKRYFNLQKGLYESNLEDQEY